MRREHLLALRTPLPRYADPSLEPPEAQLDELNSLNDDLVRLVAPLGGVGQPRPPLSRCRVSLSGAERERGGRRGEGAGRGRVVR